MKFAEKSLRIVLGVLLMGAAANSLALSLGRMRGAAIVGRPLDATLSVQLDASEGLSAVCAAVDVFFGDSQVSSSRVRVATSASPTAGEALIRIRTTSVVDEPVVTLYVQEGCQQKNTTRKYVMLAEALADNIVPVPAVSPPAPAAVQLPVVPGTRDTRDARGATATGAGEGQAESVPRAGARKASKAKPQADSTGIDAVPRSSPRTGAMAFSLAAPPARQARKAKAGPEAAQPSRSRLKLDPIDLTEARDPVLRSSPELLTAPSSDPGQRAAAAALWQALNAQPQEMERHNQRLKSLEADVANMLAQGRKTDTAITELRGQLEQARGERYANGLVYALGGLLALALAAAAFLWVRSRQQQRGPWWGDEAGGGKRGMESGFAAAAAIAAAGTSRSQKSVVDLNLDDLHAESTESRPAPLPVKPARAPEAREHPEFLPSLGGLSGMPRIVNAEELFDVQQQADFFLSLGHTDKAVEVLLHHIMDNVETSALVYLDLLDLYHKLGRRDEYDALRKDFHRMFNAQVPAFDDYAMDSHGLEFYVAALTRIESLWPTSKVLDVLEESIFRKPDSRSEVFSLAAYRELLLLHSIAKKVIAPVADAGAPSALNTPTTSFGPTNIQPLSAKLQETPPPLPTGLPIPHAATAPEAASAVPPSERTVVLDLTRPPVSSRLGLDIDLSLEVEGALAPLPSIVVPDAPDASLEPKEVSNLIEFDLDTPIVTAPVPKP
ncbi:FimV family protein [Polaromonas sp. YR568]|uniref:type IV pilus assembly protein FimV n=1 Tax=Polaromonas sp. YR568 TaxID=1855301 RepID=UPI000B87CC8B|nr:hypothetical protein [Polaromonas sp. YR568]